MDRHVANAQRIAEWLEAHEDVERVWYAGLASSPWHEQPQRYAPKGAGAIVSFELTGGVDAGKRFVDGVSLFTPPRQHR
jgi:O-acetylhomoserine (thiol)-lyase